MIKKENNHLILQCARFRNFRPQPKFVMDPLFELNDKLIFVSGGSRRIGKALVSGFAKRGERVVFTGRDEDSLESATTWPC